MLAFIWCPLGKALAPLRPQSEWGRHWRWMAGRIAVLPISPHNKVSRIILQWSFLQRYNSPTRQAKVIWYVWWWTTSSCLLDKAHGLHLSLYLYLNILMSSLCTPILENFKWLSTFSTTSVIQFEESARSRSSDYVTKMATTRLKRTVTTSFCSLDDFIYRT